jgi:hypothetical protein
MHAYQSPQAEMTLIEGLQEYRRVHEGLAEERGPDSLFRFHDLCHVVFGTDTSLAGEAITDTWTMFGTDVGLSGYMKYLKDPQAKRIFEDIGYLRMTVDTVRYAPLMLEAYRRTRRMKRKWPFHANNHLYDVPLVELRRRYGIQVFSGEG